MTELNLMPLDAVDRSMLEPLVCQALQDESASVSDWFRQPLVGGFSGAAVQRFWGQVQTAEGDKPWSLVLKVITPQAGDQAPTEYNYWKREVLLYQSDLLADLPRDLVAPRCYKIQEHPDNEYWLWLEDMRVATADRSDENRLEEEWPLARYGLAARHLGQFNGAYLVGRPIPQHNWLRMPDVRQRLALAAAGIPQLPQLQQHRLFADLLAGDRVARIIHFWEQRERLLAALDRLPQTFCHRDAFRRNLFRRWSADGQEQTVAIDWGSAGLGMLGEELVPLFDATLSFVAIDIDRIGELAELIFAGYLAGLRDAGWAGDERLVRFGFTALTVLKEGVASPATKLPNIARRAATLAEPPRLLSPGGVVQAAAVSQYRLGMGDEALALLNELT